MGVPWSGFCSRSRCSLRILLAKLRYFSDICKFLFRNDSKLPYICVWMGTEEVCYFCIAGGAECLSRECMRCVRRLKSVCKGSKSYLGVQGK